MENEQSANVAFGNKRCVQRDSCSSYTRRHIVTSKRSIVIRCQSFYLRTYWNHITYPLKQQLFWLCIAFAPIFFVCVFAPFPSIDFFVRIISCPTLNNVWWSAKRARHTVFFVIRSHFVCAVNIEYHLPSSDCCYRFVLKRFSVCQCAVVRFVVIDARVFFRCVRIFTHRNYEQWQKTKLWWKTVDNMMTTFLSFCLVRCVCVCVRRHLWRKLFRLDTCTVIVVSCFWCWWVDRFWITTHR